MKREDARLRGRCIDRNNSSRERIRERRGEIHFGLSLELENARKDGVLMQLEIKFCRVQVIHLPPVALLSYSPRLFSTPQFMKISQ